MERNADGSYTVTCRYVMYKTKKHPTGTKMTKEQGDEICAKWDSVLITERISKTGYIDWDQDEFVNSSTLKGEETICRPPGIDQETWDALLKEADN